MRNKAAKHDRVIGYLSLTGLALEILGIFILLSYGALFGIMDVIYLATFGYLSYKTLHRKKKLNTGEKILFYIIFSLLLLGALSLIILSML